MSCTGDSQLKQLCPVLEFYSEKLYVVKRNAYESDNGGDILSHVSMNS